MKTPQRTSQPIEYNSNNANLVNKSLTSQINFDIGLQNNETVHILDERSDANYNHLNSNTKCTEFNSTAANKESKLEAYNYNSKIYRNSDINNDSKLQSDTNCEREASVYSKNYINNINNSRESSRRNKSREISKNNNCSGNSRDKYKRTKDRSTSRDRYKRDKSRDRYNRDRSRDRYNRDRSRDRYKRNRSRSRDGYLYKRDKSRDRYRYKRDKSRSETRERFNRDTSKSNSRERPNGDTSRTLKKKDDYIPNKHYVSDSSKSFASLNVLNEQSVLNDNSEFKNINYRTLNQNCNNLYNSSNNLVADDLLSSIQKNVQQHNTTILESPNSVKLNSPTIENEFRQKSIKINYIYRSQPTDEYQPYPANKLIQITKPGVYENNCSSDNKNIVTYDHYKPGMIKLGQKWVYPEDESLNEVGTWEHKKRLQEMALTEAKAKQLTESSIGKHHLGDFLPKDKLEEFNKKIQLITSGKPGNIPFLGTSDKNITQDIIDESNKGFKMLKKHGWEQGQGLGAQSQGIVNPIIEYFFN
ncbi:hypothetical protein BB561_001507 [Smittium simulii]|uniref:G-patch domain-containing protein n=1 Tax=Smittium simulii TaxID=133385 RepID=A0A2T9YUC0_9FUNG|nr:hypothetical protein BB561_001507 [Smittium simulii]